MNSIWTWWYHFKCCCSYLLVILESFSNIPSVCKFKQNFLFLIQRLVWFSSRLEVSYCFWKSFYGVWIFLWSQQLLHLFLFSQFITDFVEKKQWVSMWVSGRSLWYILTGDVPRNFWSVFLSLNNACMTCIWKSLMFHYDFQNCGQLIDDYMSIFISNYIPFQYSLTGDNNLVSTCSSIL